MFAITVPVTVLRAEVKRIGDHQNFTIKHMRFHLHTRIALNRLGTSLCKEKCEFRGHECILLLPESSTNQITHRFLQQLQSEWMKWGTRSNFSSSCAYSVRLVAKCYKELPLPMWIELPLLN